MWTYISSTGEMLEPNGSLLTTGYSGAYPSGINNPLMETVPDIGPIPTGNYTFMDPVDSPTHGPFAMPLVPDTDNEMFGRSGFMCHGDSTEHPGHASEGCIILGRPYREGIWASGDHRLQVISASNAADVSRAAIGED